MRLSLLCLALLGSLVALTPASGAADKPAGPTASAPSLLQSLDKRWRSLREPGPNTGSRDLIGYALEAAAAGAPMETIERCLTHVVAMQDKEPKSKTYGNLQWYWGRKEIADPNAVEFCMQQAVLLRIHFYATLSPVARSELDAFMQLAIEGMHRHRVPVAYTNIYLMKTGNLILAGETLGRPELVTEGIAMQEEWLRFTARCGITEYLSPNYYGVDLDCLGLVAREAKSEKARTLAELALNYLWTDLAANFFGPAERLGGANSRCYQYLPGRGALDRHFSQAGWQSSRKPTGFFDTAVMQSHPRTLTDPIRKLLPRTSVQHWGEEPWRIATHYQCEDFSLGSAGANNNSDDRALVLIATPGLDSPEIIWFMDGRGDPYGTQKTPDRSSHQKALHLTPFVATVQRGPELIQLLSDDLSRPGRKRPRDSFAGLWTQLPIPDSARVFSGGKEVSAGSPDSPTQLRSDEPVFLRLGTVGVALRFLCATDTKGGTAPLQFIKDSPKDPAKRLTLVHEAHSGAGRGVAVLWMRVASKLDDAGFAAFCSQFEGAKSSVERTGNRILVRAAGLTGQLGIEADLAKEERLLLEGGEPDSAGAVLRINGVEWADRLLGAYRVR